MKRATRVPLTPSLIEKTKHRFWTKVRTGPSCHEWTGALTSTGYGSFHLRRKAGACVTITAHVYAWESQNGPVPDGMQLDHLCSNRKCLRLEHLEPVTPKVNVNRGKSPNVTTKLTGICQRGHILDFVPCNGGTGMRCRPCRNAHVRACDKKRRVFQKRLVAEARRQVAIINGLTYMEHEARAEYLEVG